jgi:acylphosphatase
MKEHWVIRITGHVQGVHYRAHAKEKADKLGVRGTIQNERDGSVTLEVEGTSEQLTKLVRWCHNGSPGAEVRSVKVQPGVVRGFTHFFIKRAL